MVKRHYIFPPTPGDEPLQASAQFTLYPAGEYAAAPAMHSESEETLAEHPALQAQFADRVAGFEPELRVMVLEDCLLLPHGAIVTREGALVAESLFPYASEPWISRSFADTLSVQEDGTYRLTIDTLRHARQPLFHFREHGEAGYFHWLHSVLPKYGLLQQFSDAGKLPLACRPAMPFQQQSIDLLGLEAAHLFPMQAHETLICPVLYYATPLVSGGEFWKRPIYVADYLRRLAETVPAEPDAPKRLYISREDAGVRRLRNEAAVIEALQPLGVVPVTLSQYNLRQQIALMRQAELIIGAHGAGLANIAFAPPACRVIEILSPARLWPTYRAIATRSRLAYGFALGDAAESDAPYDFAVDPSKLLRTVEQML